MPEPARVTVDHEPGLSRFAIRVDGEPAGEASYRLDDGVMLMHHTAIDPDRQGQGLAAVLVKAALDHARAEGWRVRASCSYVATYLRRHPEERDLLA
jgi:hypothetical protein